LSTPLCVDTFLPAVSARLAQLAGCRSRRPRPPRRRVVDSRRGDAVDSPTAWWGRGRRERRARPTRAPARARWVWCASGGVERSAGEGGVVGGWVAVGGAPPEQPHQSTTAVAVGAVDLAATRRAGWVLLCMGTRVNACLGDNGGRLGRSRRPWDACADRATHARARGRWPADDAAFVTRRPMRPTCPRSTGVAARVFLAASARSRRRSHETLLPPPQGTSACIGVTTPARPRPPRWTDRPDPAGREGPS